MGEKIITMILQKGLDLWSGPKKYYIAKTEEVIKQGVLGTEYSPAHGSLPCKGKNDAEFKISAISGRNESICTMISFVHIIQEAAIPSDNEERVAKLALALNKYRAAIEALQTII